MPMATKAQAELPTEEEEKEKVRGLTEDEITAANAYVQRCLRTAIKTLLTMKDWTLKRLSREAGVEYQRLHSAYIGYHNLSTELYAACCAAAGQTPIGLLAHSEELLLKAGEGLDVAELLLKRCLELSPELREEILEDLRSEFPPPELPPDDEPVEGAEAVADKVGSR